MKHIQQYARWGREGFRCRYSEQLLLGKGIEERNSVEAEAYDLVKNEVYPLLQNSQFWSLRPVSSHSQVMQGKAYIIQNRASYYFIDNYYGRTGDDSTRTVAPKDNFYHPNLLWWFEPNKNTYCIKNLASGKYLENNWGRTGKNSVQCHDLPDPDHPNYNWRLQDMGDGYIAIQNVASNLFLDNWYSTTDLGGVTCANDPFHHNHQWKLYVHP